MTGWRHRLAYVAAALIALGSVSAVVGRALTREPYVDEAWYSAPAANLAANGSIGTPVLETVGSPMPGMKVSTWGIREHTYWLMPLPIVVQAAWYKLVGFSLHALRTFSMLWAVVALGACFLLVKTVTADRALAWLSLGLIATDSVFMASAAIGRMDMMSAALGYSALAAYAMLRRRSLGRALLVSHVLVVGSGLAHPNGGMVALICLILLTLHLDRRELKWRHLGTAVLPYAIGALGWGLYIFQDPAAFRAQFFQNTEGRLSALSSPGTLFWREVTRYLEVYGFNLEARGLSRLKVLVLVAYAGGLAMACLNRRVRNRPGGRVFLFLAATAGSGLTVLENYKAPAYLIHVIPMLAILTAMCAQELACRFRRGWIAVAVGVLMTMQVAGMIRINVRNVYARDYLPTIQFLERRAGTNALVMASSEMAFGFGFRDNLVDDIRLGYLSGKRPDVIVMGSRYWDGLDRFERLEPAVYHYIKRCLDQDFRAEFRNPSYAVYVRRGPL